MDESDQKSSPISILVGAAVLVAGIIIGIRILIPLFGGEPSALLSQDEPSRDSTQPAGALDLPEGVSDIVLVSGADEETESALITALNSLLDSQGLGAEFFAVGQGYEDQITPAIILLITPAGNLYEIRYTSPENTPSIHSIEGAIQPWQSLSPGMIPAIVTRDQIDFAAQCGVALIQITLGHPEESIEILESLRGVVPAESAEAGMSNLAIHAFISGLASTAAGQQIDGLKSYSQAIRYRPDFINAYINRGAVYLSTGDETTAISTFERALQAGVEDSGELSFNLALAYLEANDLTKAEDYAREARSLAGDTVWTASLTGSIAYLKGQYEESLDDFTWVLIQLPDDPVALANLGTVQAATGAYEEALESYTRVVELRGLANDFLHQAEVLTALDKPDAAVDALDQAITRSPDDETLLILRGRILLSMNNLEAGRDDADAAIVLNPQSGNAFYLIGDILSQQELWNDARNAYTQAISFGVDDAALYAHRGWAGHMLRMTAAAAEDYQTALDRGYDDPLLLYWLGIALFDSGYTTDSLDILFSAVNASDTAEINAALALALDANVRRDEADQAYARAIELDERFIDPAYLETLPLWNQLSISRAQNILRRLGYLE